MTTRSEIPDPSAAGSENYLWIGGLTGNWQDPANWSLGSGIPASVSPGLNDNATIDTAADVTQEIDGTGSAASLTLDGANLISGQITAQTLKDNGALSLGSGAGVLATSATFGSRTLNYADYIAGMVSVDVRDATLVVGDGSINATSFRVGSGAQVRFDTLDVAAPTAFNVDPTSSIEIGSASLSSGLLPSAGAVTIDPGAMFTMPGYFGFAFAVPGLSTSIEKLIDNGSLSIAVPPVNPRLDLTTLSIGSLSGTGDFSTGGTVKVTDILPGTLHIAAPVQPEDFRFANLDVTGSIGAGNIIDFSNALAVSLDPDVNGTYDNMSGTIANFSPISELELNGTGVTSVAYASGPGEEGTLSILAGSTVIGRFAITGDYADKYFVASNDGEETIVNLSAYRIVNGVMEIPTSPGIIVSLFDAVKYLPSKPVGVDVSGAGTLDIDNDDPLQTLQIETGATAALVGRFSDSYSFHIGSVQIASGGTLRAATIDKYLDGSITGSGRIATSANAPIHLDGSVSSGITLDVEASTTQGTISPVVFLDEPGSFDATIAGFTTGQAISLTGSFFAPLTSQVTTATFTDVTLTDLGQIVGRFHFAGDYQGDIFSTDENGLLTEVPCYCGGTRILTPNGEVPVEELHVGDIVTTADQGQQQISWIGRRSLDLSRRHARTIDLRPVRIRARAFPDGRPHRDLLVTPDHCILVQDHLVPARLLVNGGSILFDISMTGYEFFHIELERHAILLAEGLQAESYLDTGNRDNFSNAFLSKLWPEFAIPSGHKTWRTDAAAPLMVDPVVLEPIWYALAERAVEQGQMPAPLPSSTREADLRLLLPDGQFVRLERVLADGRHCFLLHHQPDSPAQVRLVSRHAAAADLRPWVDDRRQLGVAVSCIRLWTRSCGLNPIGLPLQDSALAQGWWPQETTLADISTKAAECWRWTNGDAVLALPQNCMRIEISIRSTSEYGVPEHGTIAQSA